jgi:zinc protease
VTFRPLARRGVLAAAALLMALAQPALALPPGVTQGPSVEGITEYTLANGLRVLLFPDDSKQTITVNVTYLVGSRNEAYGETGMAHLLEHLMFKGSKQHPKLSDEMAQRFSNMNGSTYYDRTNYYETFPASKETLEWALRMEADRMVTSRIAKSDLDSEMSVVRNEFEIGENRPSSVLFERMLSTAYLWHNYGHPPIGARSDIENVPIERLQAFYRNYYQPDNAVLLVAGKFEPDSTLGLIAKTFGQIPRPKRKLQTTYTTEPTQDGEREVTLRRVGDVQVAGAVYHVPAATHPDYAAISILSGVLGDTPSGRLYKALVDPGLASSVAGFDLGLKEAGSMVFLAEVPLDHDLEKAGGVLTRTVEGLAAEPPTAQEVGRARNKILRDLEISLADPSDLGVELSEFIAAGDWRLVFLYRDWIEKVTPEDVLGVAQRYLKPSNRTVGFFVPTAAPERAEITAPPDVQSLVATYQGRQALAAGEAFDPTPQNIAARTEVEALASGMRLALLAKKTRGDSVAAVLTLRVGDETTLANKATISELAAAMLTRGTKTMTRQQIQDRLAELRAEMKVSGDVQGVTVQIKAKRDTLPDVLRLVGDVLRNPTFPEAELQQLVKESVTDVEQSRSDPSAVGMNRLRRQLSPYPKGHPGYVGTFDEDIEDLKRVGRGDIVAFHEGFYGASDGLLSVVGDFDPAVIRPLANELFGEWKSQAKYVRIPERPVRQETAKEVLELPDKTSAVFLAGAPLTLGQRNPDYAAFSLADYILGGGFLNSRLATRIRQKDGLSYAVGSSTNASAFEERGTWLAYAMSAPENTKKAAAGVDEEVRRALTKGFEPKEVAEAKTGLLSERKGRRADDSYVATLLVQRLHEGRALDWDAGYDARIEKLTPDEVSSALRKNLDPKLITTVEAGDFSK